MLNFVFFSLIFLFLSNWSQIFSFSKLIVGKKIKTSSLDDKWIKDIVRKKTGLNLLDITIFHDQKMYGMMPGLPFYPKMILSEGLYKTFNKDELEWVILHEAAHCVLWHNLQAFVIEVSILIFGIYFLSQVQMNLFLTLFFSVLLGLICIQIIRWTIEYSADKFSIEKVDNPRGVITAQDKFRKSKFKNPLSDEKSILRFLMVWNIPASKRIEMARNRL